MKKEVTVTVTWEIDEDMYLPADLGPTEEEVEEINLWLAEDDVDVYLRELHIEKIVRDSMEKLGATTLEATVWTTWTETKEV
jgi:hypothetical protein